MNIAKIGTAILMSVTLAACAAPEEQRQSLQETAIVEGWTRVSAEEAKVLLADTTLSGSSGGTKWQTYYSADQIQRGYAKGSDWEETDEGTYEITPEGIYCRTWKRWSDAQEGCAEIYQKGDNVRLIVVSGKLGNDPQFEGVVQQGNPFDL